MARSVLTKEAISYLVKMYECEKSCYTFAEIADLINSKYGIKVSGEAVRKSYHKNKDSFNPLVEIVENQPNKAQIFKQPKKESIIKTKRSFNDEVNQDDLNDIMSQFEE